MARALQGEWLSCSGKSTVAISPPYLPAFASCIIKKRRTETCSTGEVWVDARDSAVYLLHGGGDSQIFVCLFFLFALLVSQRVRSFVAGQRISRKWLSPAKLSEFGNGAMLRSNRRDLRISERGPTEWTEFPRAVCVYVLSSE